MIEIYVIFIIASIFIICYFACVHILCDEFSEVEFK